MFCYNIVKTAPNLNRAVIKHEGMPYKLPQTDHRLLLLTAILGYPSLAINETPLFFYLRASFNNLYKLNRYCSY